MANNSSTHIINIKDLCLPNQDHKQLDAETSVDLVLAGRKQIISIIELLPQLVYLKEAKTRKYIFCNKKFANFLNLESREDIIGTKAEDFISKVKIYDNDNLEAAKELEDQAIKYKKILQAKREIEFCDVGDTTVTGTIVPILDNNGEVDSLLCYGSPFMLISDKSFTDAFKVINKDNITTLVTKPKYQINHNQYGEIKISRRETQCILHMLKGLTSREIAEQMSVSTKTVEKYIESIKNKTNCNSRSELISTLIEGGLIDDL